MASSCITSSAAVVGCVVEPTIPVRATYTNLFKWPESDAEFVRSVSSAGSDGSGKYRVYSGSSTTVVDSYFCRQMYLRSYTFSRKETAGERTRKFLATVKEKVAEVAAVHGKKGSEEGEERKGRRDGRKGPSRVRRRLKEVSCSVFRTLLSCTASVDVVDDLRRI